MLYLNFQQELHDLPLLEFVRGERVFIDINEQFVEVLRVLWLHEGQLLGAPLRLGVQ